MIIAQGGAFAGWSLYLLQGKPKYCHNLAGLMRFYVEGTESVPAGTHQVRMEFAYDDGGLADRSIRKTTEPASAGSKVRPGPRTPDHTAPSVTRRGCGSEAPLHSP